MFERIDGSKATPADLSVSTALEKFDIDTVRQLWLKAMERRETDPQGAITLARTLLEAVCKHILDEHGIEYDATGDLPALYKTVAKALNIAHPSSSKFSEVAPQLWKGSDHCAIASVMRTAKAGIPYVPPPAMPNWPSILRVQWQHFLWLRTKRSLRRPTDTAKAARIVNRSGVEPTMRLRHGRCFGFLMAKLGGCASRSKTNGGWMRRSGSDLSKGLFKLSLNTATGGFLVHRNGCRRVFNNSEPLFLRSKTIPEYRDFVVCQPLR